MKNYLLSLLAVASLFTACKKEPNGGSTAVKFTSTTYVSLGTTDEMGRPTYLADKDVVTNNLYTYVTGQLPEGTDVRTSHPEYLKNADLAVTAKSDVYITFVNEGTKHTNTVGFYQYKTGSAPTKPEDIQQITYIFPNSSLAPLGSMQRGDKVKIGTFESGMSIGFVLLDNGWDAASKTINSSAPHYCSSKELNPENRDELKPHTVLFEFAGEGKTIIGFEDLNRTDPKCDHDFNDVVVYATVVAAK